MPYAYAYLRVSHRDSAASGISPDVQAAQFAEWFTYASQTGRLPGIERGRIGWQGGPDLDENGRVKRHQQTGEYLRVDRDRDDGIFIDLATSAYRRKFLTREAGVRLNMYLKAGDIVWFPRLDRSFRNAGDACAMEEQWRKRGIALVFNDMDIDTRTAAGRAFFQMAAVWAELDSSMKSERILEIKAHLRRTGKPLNQHKQLGYRCTSTHYDTWVPDEAERRVVKGIIAARHSLPGGKVRSWPQVSDLIEREQARAEGRPIRTLNSKPPRQWTERRCRDAYRQALAAGWAELPPGAQVVTRIRRKRGEQAPTLDAAS
jgi:DNA invertase Pin-like site-specific DNA recombinase